MASFKNSYGRRAFIAETTCSLTCLLTGSLKIQAALSSPFISSKEISSKENTIPTLSGMIEVSKLGTTLMHEHVLFGNIPENLRSASVDIALKLLNEARDAGIKTIVDLTPYRDINLYRQIADKTTINIIASTGYYTRSKMPAMLSEKYQPFLFRQLH